MRLFWLFLFAVLLLLPTAATATLGVPSNAGDERLAQTVTYCGYGRLSKVIDYLTSTTRVSIRCGRTTDDWRVLDIPVTVCVKDMPLGKLLRYLADATHSEFTMAPPVEGKPRCYRIARSRELADAIASSRDERIKANVALAGWAWDSVVAYSKMPDAPVDIPAENGNVDISPREMKLVGQLLGSISPADREKAFAGQQIYLKSDNSTQSAVLRDLYLLACKDKTQNGYKAAQPTDDETQNAELAIRISEDEKSDSWNRGLSVWMRNIPYEGWEGREYDYWDTNLAYQADRLARRKLPGLPARPQVDRVLKPNDLFPSPGFVSIKETTDRQRESLQARVLLEAPSNGSYLKLSDVLIAVAQAAKMNVICEDFYSHQLPTYPDFNSGFGKDPTAADVLRQCSPQRLRFFLNDEEKLLIGWADEWRDRHNHMVPGSLIDRINRARRGSGAELDDATPLFELNSDQLREWIWWTPEFLGWQNLTLSMDGRPLWQYYNSLNAKEKELAKSLQGLPLDGCDTEGLSSFLEKRQEGQDIPEYVKSPEYKRTRDIFTSPELLSRSVIRVFQTPLDRWQERWVIRERGADLSHYKPKPGGSVYKHEYVIDLDVLCPLELDFPDRKHGYTLELSGEKDGVPYSIKVDLSLPFPIFMPEKEAEIHRLNTKEEPAKKPSPIEVSQTTRPQP